MSARRKARPKPAKPNSVKFSMNSCSSGKRVFDTKSEARQVARLLRKEGDNALMTPYVCPECEGIHIGHLPKAVRRGEITRDEYYERGAA